MTRLGLQLIPHLPVGELIETVQAAEELGYDYCPTTPSSSTSTLSLPGTCTASVW